MGKKRFLVQVTITIDDAGSGDLLFGVVIAAFREETGEFKYGIVDVKFFQELFSTKKFLGEASDIAVKLVKALKLKSDEIIRVCQGNIFDKTVAELQNEYGEERVKRVKVTGEAQRLTEIAFLDEIRNLGYEPLEEREAKRAKSFFHMMRWLSKNPKMIKYAKTGLPRLKKYRIFKQFHKEDDYTAVCDVCGNETNVPFKPDPKRPIFCQTCLKKHRKPKRKKNSQ